MPTEILRAIAENVAYPKGEHIPEYDTRASTLVYPNADLKALRLSSKALRKAGAPFLFSDVQVYMTASSFARLIAIAAHAELSQLVRHVIVFPAQYWQDDRSRSNYNHEVRLGPVYMQFWDFDKVSSSQSYLSADTRARNMLWGCPLLKTYSAAQRLPWPSLGMLKSSSARLGRHSPTIRLMKVSCTIKNSLMNTRGSSRISWYASKR